MPRRTDIETICLVGSGPIVIGQAAEFDYAGCQALKVLREDGFRTIVVNSNPATIMTDPGFADRTYLEPLDLEGVADVLRRERPDALLPTMGGQTALNLARELAESGILDRARHRADRREPRGDPARRGPAAVQAGGRVLRPEGADVADRQRPRRRRRDRAAGRRPSGVHARRPRRRVRDDARRAPPPGRDRPAREPDRPGARRGVGARLGRVRARGRPRPRRQRRDRLLDREPRPDGRAHRRLRHGRAADDASRRGVPGAARRGGGGRPCGRRRHRRIEHPVRAVARDRRGARDRDEPARVALVGARVEGDRLSDREGRGEARGRLHARRDPERPHRHDAGELRADARLRRRQVPALRVREVPRRGPDARHADEVRRRDDGHRPHVHGGVPQGDALTRARPRRRDAVAAARRRPRGRASVLQGGDREPSRTRCSASSAAASTTSSPATGSG